MEIDENTLNLLQGFTLLFGIGGTAFTIFKYFNKKVDDHYRDVVDDTVGEKFDTMDKKYDELSNKVTLLEETLKLIKKFLGVEK